PLGAIYNPAMTARTLMRATDSASTPLPALVPGPRGMHCLDYATRFSGKSQDVLADLETAFTAIREILSRRPTVILTFGSAFVYQHAGRIIGNCHKFPASEFERRILGIGEIVDAMEAPMRRLIGMGCRVILTVSPIRHTADGLHGNTVSKATLHLAVEALRERIPEADYFPAYEILIDDLRDYRFYADDLKHPSAMAVTYIYEKFMEAYLLPSDIRKAIEARKAFMRSQHRPIL
ncbi:MAG: GSCFA domain-containing protein, partial [Muribaculaceae bacterium]|nr:GSCFA domain-containing protein [Muribaculaceae bacterium]